MLDKKSENEKDENKKGCLGCLGILIVIFLVIGGCNALFNNDDESESDTNKQEKKKTKVEDEENKKEEKKEEKAKPKKEVEETSKKIEDSKVETPKAMTEDEYKGVIRSYQMQIQLAGEDLQKLQYEINDNGRLTNKGKDLVYAIYGSLDGADLILKGVKDNVVPPSKYENDHQNLLDANEHFQNAARSLEDFEQSENTDSLDNALNELNIATENADIDVRNILE
ncbi:MULTISPECIES: hypothetical protein [Staphylococcus intermedius group]|uniref:Lipoprotein n=1 Tax=Staphylococcus intermedius NCTC 11048 TaxID=1141106 RepID=A0A380G747_STAIN|nr:MULTISPECIES: hypothetical protein [Staphylococcus intermedius group]PCF64536.1 hypothetical protein B5C04_00370 [Staphylococcus intermedius]PCF79282.1 hypothetical protein B4W69_13275 [Staphylococcus delphini]PCF81495.1 hypothetical protein B4W70_00370 [Staphylococcus intermedius]PNZ48387.1 hypothetical protein CD138_13575 [Staphylococcus intermedius NCTC 11048]SUM46327.1 lipoprotein [Staphylococcus intermedius NCTC 11048]